MFKLPSIINSLLKVGAHISGSQYELLKWRTSDDAKKYYTFKENRIFYKKLKKGDLSVVDAIRKEKQKRINDMKNKLIIIIILLTMTSCFTIPTPKNEWDPNSLKDHEKTYQIKEQDIKIQDNFKKVRFDDDWYLVHEDFIKTFNENQDDLLKSLDKINSGCKLDTVHHIVMLSIVVMLIIILVGIFKQRGKS